jgi:hypothetical protein
MRVDVQLLHGCRVAIVEQVPSIAARILWHAETSTRIAVRVGRNWRWDSTDTLVDAATAAVLDDATRTRIVT